MKEFRAKMKEKIKLYSNEEYLDGYIQNEFLTDDGDADIFLNVEEKYELFDSWTVGNQVDLEKDIYDFIEEKTAMLENDVPIHLHIIGCSFTPHEQGIIRHILKEHYAIELYKVQKKYTHMKRKIIGLCVFGLITFLLYTIVFFQENFNYTGEVFGYLFSFALWEAADCIIYSFSEIQNEREAITQNLLINVDFDRKEEKEKDLTDAL